MTRAEKMRAGLKKSVKKAESERIFAVNEEIPDRGLSQGRSSHTGFSEPRKVYRSGLAAMMARYEAKHRE